MTEKEIEIFYLAGYRYQAQGTDNPTPKDLAVQGARAAAQVHFVRRRVAAVERALDIGASAGLLLKALHQQYACDISGVEPGKAYRSFARESGIRMVASIDELQGEQFDFVAMSHVLEHLPDPVAYLSNLREGFLRAPGWLLVEVPNLYCHESFEFAHLTSFCQTTLKQTLEKAGYEIVRIERHGRPYTRLLPYYLTALARPGRNRFVPHSERHVPLKRAAGLAFRDLVSFMLPHLAWNAPSPNGETNG
jgi:SAM-dependent methyltransferase